ncbi:ATP-binding protein [Burkholderia stabilis]|uniref:ATP-binding protein n=1 Tax=Burkholderia stabilis TaxID=95485 RepID=UPI00396570D6
MPQGVREGGRVEITCGSPAEGDGARIRLLVADDRQGVPVDERARIFERIYRVPGTAQRGSGIGLSLVAGRANRRISRRGGRGGGRYRGARTGGDPVVPDMAGAGVPAALARASAGTAKRRRVTGAREAGARAPRAVISA